MKILILTIFISLIFLKVSGQNNNSDTSVCFYTDTIKERVRNSNYFITHHNHYSTLKSSGQLKSVRSKTMFQGSFLQDLKFNYIEGKLDEILIIPTDYTSGKGAPIRVKKIDDKLVLPILCFGLLCKLL